MFSVRCIFPIFLAGTFPASPQGLTPAQTERYQELSVRPLRVFSNADLAEYLDLRTTMYESIGRPDPAEEIGNCALKSLETPFRLKAGRFGLCQADCVTFVERTIALALASDWESYYLLCERLRHKDGKVEFLGRNFFTLADWVPNNAWLLKDITQELGIETTTFQYAVFRKRFYENLQFGQDATAKGQAKAAAQAAKVAAAPEKEVLTACMIDRQHIAEAVPALKTGDIALFIRTRSGPGLKPWYECNHMGIVVVEPDGEINLVSAMPAGASPGKVRRHPLRGMMGYTHSAGFVFLRLRADIARDANGPCAE